MALNQRHSKRGALVLYMADEKNTATDHAIARDSHMREMHVGDLRSRLIRCALPYAGMRFVDQG